MLLGSLGHTSGLGSFWSPGGLQPSLRLCSLPGTRHFHSADQALGGPCTEAAAEDGVVRGAVQSPSSLGLCPQAGVGTQDERYTGTLGGAASTGAAAATLPPCGDRTVSRALGLLHGLTAVTLTSVTSHGSV